MQIALDTGSHKLSVIDWSGDGDSASAAKVYVAQVVGDDLNLVGGKTGVVMNNIIVSRP